MGQQPETKSGFLHADKPRIHRLSSADFVPPSVYIQDFVRSCFRRDVQDIWFVFDALEVLEGTRDGCPPGESTRRRPVLPGPALPRRLGVRRRIPTRPWYARVLDSTGENKLDTIVRVRSPACNPFVN